MRAFLLLAVLSTPCLAQEDKDLTQQELAEIWDKMALEDREYNQPSFRAASWLSFPMSLCRAMSRGQRSVYPNGGFGEARETNWPASFSFDAVVRIGDQAGVLRYFVTPDEVGYVVCWDSESWFQPRGIADRLSPAPVVFRIQDGNPERFMIVESPRWDAATSTRPTTPLVFFSSDFGLAQAFRKLDIEEADGALISNAGKHTKVINRFDATANTFKATIPKHFVPVSVTRLDESGEEKIEAQCVRAQEVLVKFDQGTGDFSKIKSIPAHIVVKQTNSEEGDADAIERVLCEIRLRRFEVMSSTGKEATSAARLALLPDARRKALGRMKELFGGSDSKVPPFYRGLGPAQGVSDKGVFDEAVSELTALVSDFDPGTRHLPKAAAELTKLQLRILVMITTGRDRDRLLPALKRYYAILKREQLSSTIVRSANELVHLLRSFGGKEQAYVGGVWAQAYQQHHTVTECLARIRTGPPMRQVWRKVPRPILATRLDAMLANTLAESNAKLEPIVECEIRYWQCVLAKTPVPGYDPGPVPDVPCGQSYSKAERLYASLSEPQKKELSELRGKAGAAVGRSSR